MGLRLLLALLSSLLCLAVYSNAVADTKDVIVDRVDEKEIGVSFAVGQRLIVRTGAAPTTAYRWEVIDLPDCIKFIGKYKEGIGEALPGGPQRSSFVLEALSRCEGTIKFSYFAGSQYRGVSVADNFAIHVDVE